MCMYVSADVYVMCAGAQGGPKETSRFPWRWSYRMLWVVQLERQEYKSGQQVLLTSKSPFQPQLTMFYQFKVVLDGRVDE